MNRQADDFNVNIFEQISQVCREFRKQISQGKATRIETCLSAISEAGREALFSNLLEIEINFRRTKGQLPSSDEYLKRFPQFAKQVRRAFFEPTMGSSDSVSSVDGETRSLRNAAVSPADTQTFESPAANRLGDYELIRELGRGGMGVVYEARHIKRGNRVALKTLPTGVDGQEINAERLHKFRREFRSLSEINHPNLVGMQTLEVDGSQWFFTMDLIEGENFLSYVRPMEQLDEERLRLTLKQLAKGIIFLHDQGIVHRDLKPSNVLVEPDGRVVILDFGLVAQLQTNTDLTVSRSGMFAGTPRYAAPEQMFGERSEASDWYAFGTMLYESLTGLPPFAGKNPMELLRQKQNEDPALLVEQEQTEVAEDLAVLTDGLLKRDPKRRFNTSQIVAALQLEPETRTHGSTAGSKGSTGSVDEDQLDPLALFDEEIVLIGREQQLAQLENTKQKLLEKRKPLVVWITGKSGEGKSSLAEKFLQPIRNGTDMLVLSGRCYDRESVPFKAIDSIIDSLVRFLNSHHGKPHQSSLPEDFAFLARLFPLLNRVKAIGKAKTPHVAQMDSEKIRARGFYALRELLTTISLRTPVVVSIDDLQWADADSAQAWVEVLTGVDAPALLFLGSYRSDEVAESPFLQTWNRLACGESRHLDSLEIGVEPLSRAQCIELAAIRTGAASRMIHQQADELFEDTGGNPYFLEQLIEGFDAETGSFRHVPLGEIITEKLQKLPETAGALLNVIAVSGQPISLEEAAQVATGSESEQATLTHMRSERLVRLVGGLDQSMVDTYHDKIRETLLAGMPESQRQRLHLELANAIEAHAELDAEDLLKTLSASTTAGDQDQAVSPRIFDLAHHFSEADDPRAFQYQLAAGLAGLKAFAMEEAREYLRNARTIRPQSLDSSIRFQLEYAYALALSGTGSMDASREHFTEAMQFAGSSFEKALCYAGRGNGLMKQGNLIDAKEDFYEVMELMGEPEPRSLFSKLGGIAVNAFRLFIVPSWSPRRRQVVNRNDQAERLIAVTRSLLGHALLTDLPALLRLFFKMSADAKFSKHVDTRVHSHAAAAHFFSLNGIMWLAKKYQGMVISQLKQTNVPEVIASAKNYL